ncbi:MAG TPA: asparagine synthase (glutamine-hydrolyzing) [Bryobacteraceae bacterium]|nr:asparagine synthase (glutamine-hydrolyzing) [Bryobacteraceae bacterium]
MCGIAGIVRHSGINEQDRLCVARLERLLLHRGPDGAGRYHDRTCALAQTRLSLIGPLSLGLPVSSPDGRYVIVYNGEVYNFPELRQELQPATPFTLRTDTDVVLAAWIRWGSRALTRFNGMFAFFIWDALQQRGFAACDPLGIKPFFYNATADRFFFASEAGALVESGGVRFVTDDESIAESLTAPYFSSVTALPFAGIARLQPGHYLELHQGGLTISQVPQVSDSADPYSPGFLNRLGDTLDLAVSAAMRADVPVGVFLSGGVDSSLLAAIAQSHSSQPVPAWTISYSGEDTVDYSRSLIVRSPDLPFAERVASQCGCAHTVVRVDEARYEAALLRTLHTNDLISAWEQEVSQHILAETAAPHVKAVLVGDAADETHFGYSFLLNPARIESPGRVIDFFGTPPLRREFLDDPAGHFTCKYRKFAEDRGHRWTTPDEQCMAMSCLIYHLWLTRLLHNGDIHLMAHSLEGRVPFGDTRLLALARLVPQELGFRDGIEKWHLRRAAERFVEPSVAWRPKSALTKNLRAHAIIHRHFVRAWRECGAFLEPYVDCDAVERLASGDPPTTEQGTGLCFRLLAVMTWFRRFHKAAA